MKNNEIKHMTCKNAHIVDGFGHGANIFGCNMIDYQHITYGIHSCPWNIFTDDTPYCAFNVCGCTISILHIVWATVEEQEAALGCFQFPPSLSLKF